jgi:membrane protein required for colicin V production
MIFDLIFLVIFIYAAFRGFTKGLIVQAATFAALLLGLFGAIKLSGFTSNLLIEKTSIEGEYLPIVSFALTFIGIVILVHLVSKLVEKLVQAVALGFINRLAGAIFNMTKFALIVSGVLVILNTINEKKAFLPEDVERSMMYEPLSGFAPLIFPYLKFEKTPDFINNIEIPNLEEEL